EHNMDVRFMKIGDNEKVIELEGVKRKGSIIDYSRGLLELLMKNKSDIHGTNEENGVIKVCEKDNDEKGINEMDKKNMIVSSIIRDEICIDAIKINNTPESNSKVNPIEYSDETSNDKDASEFDLEIKIDSDDSNNQTSDGGETTGIEIEAPEDKESIVSGSDVDMLQYSLGYDDRSEAEAHEKKIRKGTNYEMLIGYNYDVRCTWYKILSNIKSSVPVLKLLKYVKEIGFYKQLYLDHAIGCDGLEHMIFGNRIDIRRAKMMH
ncbi:29700_t:CDS:2, partial [Gigaspora margarita]